MLISIRDYPLCDGTNAGGVAASDLRYRITRTIDVVQGLRLANPETYDRGTRTANIVFTVQRNHATVNAAELFLANHERTIPQDGAVKITSQDGVVVAYLINGRLVDFQLTNYIGATTTHSYHIVGGIFDVTPPEISFILLETGDFVLLETGDKILIE